MLLCDLFAVEFMHFMGELINIPTSNVYLMQMYLKIQIKSLLKLPDAVGVKLERTADLLNEFSCALDDAGPGVAHNAGHLHRVPEAIMRVNNNGEIIDNFN